MELMNTIIKNKTILFLSLVVLYSCTNYNHKMMDYCEILNSDQSHVNNNKKDTNYWIDKNKRHAIFQNNFKKIINHMKYSGFPPIDLNKFDRDSCKYEAVTLTFIHIAQSNIHTFFKESTKKVFFNNSKNTAQLKNLLGKSILVALNTHSISCSDALELNSFIREFQLESVVYQNEILGEKVLLFKTECEKNQFLSR